MMVTCPKCGRPVSGRARSCGYCGESLVNDYFSRTGDDARAAEYHPGPGGIASMVLGICGGVALLAALVVHLLPLFGIGDEPSMSFAWWSVTLLMTLLPVVYLVQQIVLRGERFSLVPDAAWLFLSVMALSVTMQGFLDRGTGLFSGLAAIPYLLSLGCILVAVASVTGILTFQK